MPPLHFAMPSRALPLPHRPFVVQCTLVRSPYRTAPSCALQDVQDTVYGDTDGATPSAIWLMVVTNLSLPIAAAAAEDLDMPEGVLRNTVVGEPWSTAQEEKVRDVLVTAFKALEDAGHRELSVVNPATLAALINMRTSDGNLRRFAQHSAALPFELFYRHLLVVHQKVLIAEQSQPPLDGKDPVYVPVGLWVLRATPFLCCHPLLRAPCHPLHPLLTRHVLAV